MATEAGLTQKFVACTLYSIGFVFMLFSTVFLYFVIFGIKIVFSVKFSDFCFPPKFRSAEIWGLYFILFTRVCINRLMGKLSCDLTEIIISIYPFNAKITLHGSRQFTDYRPTWFLKLQITHWKVGTLYIGPACILNGMLKWMSIGPKLSKS